MAKDRKAAQDAQEESRRILARVDRDSESIGASNLARGVDKSNPRNRSEDDDPIEKIGKRIGRTLGLIVVAVLVWHLVSTYVLQ